MPKTRLSAALAASATCPPSTRKVTFWDTVTTGFILEVRPNSATYALRFIDEHGAQRQHKIGGVHDLTFAEAEKRAKRLRSEVVLGGNPAAQREVRRAVPTYAELAAQHIAHAKTYQRSWWSVAGIITKHLLPRFGKMRLDQITSQDISQFLAEKGQELKPATIEKIRVVMGKSYALAQEWQLGGADKNPVRSVPRPRFDNRRERFLTAAEAARLLEVADRSANPQLRPILHLLLLTGARLRELLDSRHEHVDLERKTWLIPTTKTGKSRYVPLSGEAIEVIQGLPRIEGSPYLIPNPETGRPFVSIKRAFATAKKEARLSNFRLHDARHSAASFMINAGVDLFAVGRVLGHSDHRSTMRYSHVSNDTLLAAVEAGAARLGGRSR